LDIGRAGGEIIGGYLWSCFLLPWYSLTTAYLITVNLFSKPLDKPKDIDEKDHLSLKAVVYGQGHDEEFQRLLW
jgi:hypothetical protein